MQTIFGDPDGNCFAACVASILEIDLDPSMPLMDDNWLHNWKRWLDDRGYIVYWWMVGKGDIPDHYAILGGKSPRGEYNHAVVTLYGNIVHDPHPSNEGVLEPLGDWFVIARKI